MNNGVKAVLYLILVIVTGISGYFFFENFGKLFDSKKAETAEVEPAPAPVEVTADTNAPVDTNAVAQTPDATGATNALPDTNVVDAAASATNAPGDTNAVAAAAVATPTPAKTSKKADKKSAEANGTAKKPRSRIGFWTGSFFLSVLALGGFIAWDVSNYLGNRSLRVLYNDDGVGMKDEAYDKAEEEWKKGQPLDAIRLMREYLNKNPREVHVSLRIAEIYEKDLNNNLAAALEYEDILTKKLTPDRWGWSAIHLCNLYFKLNNEQKAYALLQRIVKEYGETPAAEKARKRLNEVDPSLLAEADAPDASAGSASAAPAADEPKSNLPPGFRPKK
jgi:TolA-binding protein